MTTTKQPTSSRATFTTKILTGLACAALVMCPVLTASAQTDTTTPGATTNSMAPGTTAAPDASGTMTTPGTTGTATTPDTSGTMTTPGTTGTMATPDTSGTMTTPNTSGTMAAPGAGMTNPNMGTTPDNNSVSVTVSTPMMADEGAVPVVTLTPQTDGSINYGVLADPNLDHYAIMRARSYGLDDSEIGVAYRISRATGVPMSRILDRVEDGATMASLALAYGAPDQDAWPNDACTQRVRDYEQAWDATGMRGWYKYHSGEMDMNQGDMHPMRNDNMMMNNSTDNMMNSIPGQPQ